jgi:uncharacterized membrane protein (DUF4010 family)
LPVIILLATLNISLFIAFFPVILVLIISTLGLGIFFFKRDSGAKKELTPAKKIDEAHQIFSLSSALRFVGIYLLINLSSKVAIQFFGSSGFLVTSALGSLTGLDAVVINTAQLAGNGIDLQLGVWGWV